MSDQYPTGPQGAADPTQAYPSTGPPASGHAQPQAPTGRRRRRCPPQDERTWGAISHAGAVVAMICSAGFLGFLASVAVYVVHKDRGPFVRAHAANSINIQITMFIWLVVLGILRSRSPPHAGPRPRRDAAGARRRRSSSPASCT